MGAKGLGRFGSFVLGRCLVSLCFREEVVRELQHGAVVVASGPVETVDDYRMVPVCGGGAVDVDFFDVRVLGSEQGEASASKRHRSS